MKRNLLFKMSAILFSVILLVGMGNIAFAGDPDTHIALTYYGTPTAYIWSAPADVVRTVKGPTKIEGELSVTILSVAGQDMGKTITFTVNDANTDDELTGVRYGKTVDFDTLISDQGEVLFDEPRTQQFDVLFDVSDFPFQYTDTYTGNVAFEASFLVFK